MMKQFKNLRYPFLTLLKTQSLMNLDSIQDKEIVNHINLRRQSNDSKNGITTDSFIHDQSQLISPISFCIGEICVGITFFIVRQVNPSRSSTKLWDLKGVRDWIALPY